MACIGFLGSCLTPATCARLAMEVQQGPTESPPQSVLELLELDPKSLIDDLYNAVRS